MKLEEKNDNNKAKFKFKFNKKWIKWIVILIIIIVFVFYVKNTMKKANELMKPKFETTTMQKKDIEMSLSGTGVIQPLSQYSVMPLVQGEVVKAPFEEGQKVKKDDLLYQFSTEDVENAIKSAKLSVERAELAYKDAKKLKDDLKLKSNATGYIKKLHIRQGDNIQPGAIVADVYDNTSMILSVPFNAADITGNWIGKNAKVHLNDGADTISGVVTEVPVTSEVLPGNMIVKKVKILVKNPGGITTDTLATATVGSVECNSEGTFEVKEEKQIIATGSGKVASLNIKEGGFVSKDQVYVVLDGESIDSQIKNAEIALQEAKLGLENQRNTLDNFSIKAPISGTIITKNIKKGDNVNAGSATSANGGVLAIIYDLSAVTFKMNVDELDVRSLKTGMQVIVTADALVGKEMTGYIENISLNAKAENGVTQYPITVRLDKVGELLPGMNVEGEIVTQLAPNVDTIPIDALQRGDVVYVKDTTIKEDDKKAPTPANPKVPVGFKEVKVTVGINDGNFVEITSGLTPEDLIYVPAVPAGQSLMDMMTGGAAVTYESN